MSPIQKVAFRVHETIVWDTPPDLPDLPDPAEVVSLSAAQTLPSHAPGVRMTVVINILGHGAGEYKYTVKYGM